jgi:hypothetical protein
MNPLAIIEQLDVAEDRSFSGFTACEVCMMNEFVLQIRKETLSYCVIVSCTFRPVLGNIPAFAIRSRYPLLR